MRLGDLDALMHRFMDKPPEYYHTSYIVGEINTAPTVDAVPVKHGQWEQVFEERTIHGSHCSAPNFRCSVCKKWWFHNGECVKWMKYCPECGAKMDGEKAYFKCTVYGESHSEATDWRKKWEACGLIDQPFTFQDERIVKLREGKPKYDEPLEGQISIFE